MAAGLIRLDIQELEGLNSMVKLAVARSNNNRITLELLTARVCTRKVLALHTEGAIRYKSVVPCAASLARSAYLHYGSHLDSDLLRDEALGRLTWSVRVGVLSLCKLRAGALCFSCLNGRRSRAQIQHCIFCNRRTKAARVHVLSVCDYWEVKRQQTCRQLPVTKAFAPADISRHILGCRPHQEAFASLVAWAVELDKECASWFHAQHHWPVVLICTTAATLIYSRTQLAGTLAVMVTCLQVTLLSTIPLRGHLPSLSGPLSTTNS